MTEDNIVSQAEAAASRLEAANKAMEELVRKQEALQAKAVLGGRSGAVTVQEPVLSEEQKLKNEMREVFKGTAVERALR